MKTIPEKITDETTPVPEQVLDAARLHLESPSPYTRVLLQDLALDYSLIPFKLHVTDLDNSLISLAHRDGDITWFLHMDVTKGTWLLQMQD